jgi:hypothetical protein
VVGGGWPRYVGPFAEVKRWLLIWQSGYPSFVRCDKTLK